MSKEKVKAPEEKVGPVTEEKKTTPKKLRLAEVHIYQGFGIGGGIENSNTLNPFKNKMHEKVELYANAMFVEISNTANGELFLVPYANVKYCKPWPKDLDGKDANAAYNNT